MNIDLSKYLKRTSIVFFLMLSVIGNTQEKETYKEKFFTSEETAYMDKWFSEVVLEMNLTEATKGEYYKILLENTSKMASLSTEKNDTSSVKELIANFLRQVEKMNMETHDLNDK